MRRLFYSTLAMILGALALAGPALADDGPFIPTTDILPPLVADEPAPDRVDECGEDGLDCIIWVEEQLADWEAYFGCDHRAVFPTVYRMLTHETRLFLEDDPSIFDDPAGLGFEAVQFYLLYLEMITAHLDGEPIPAAWQTAMDAALEGDWTGGHDMLLAINAHVQRDMPFAVAATGITLPDGSSRKADHDTFNQVLNAAYDTIVAEIGRRYDPIMTDIDDIGLIVDNVGAQQLVAVWREGVWRNAERVVATADTPLWDSTVTSIEVFADVTANVIKTGELPGRRELRDAHCATALAAGADGGSDADATPGATTGTNSGQDAASTVSDDASAGTSLPTTGGGAALLGAAMIAGARFGRGRRRR